uniref:F-box associated domain-containing protein n=1 Tax=Aegilops tauschii TaxID=37682 RepID=R7VZP5_AEGTA
MPGELDTSSQSTLDVLAEELEVPSQQGEVLSPEPQVMHVHVPVVEEQPKDRVISVLVFSSETDEWASREFVPGRCAPRHLYDMVNAPQASYVKIWKSAQYWQGSLYVHCWNHIIMILRNSEEAYDMAQLPGESYVEKGYQCLFELSQRSLLVSYERGVHFVVLDKFQLQVWTLTESTDGQIGWMLAHATDLSPYNHKVQQHMEPRVMWNVVRNTRGLLSLFESRKTREIIYDEDDGQSNTTDDVDSDSDDDEEEDNHEVDGFDGTTGDVGVDGYSDGGDPHKDEDGETKREEVFEYTWDSDEDNFIDLDDGAAHLGDEEYGGYRIMGLHPHKQVVLFQTYNGVVAYHIKTSRMQCLGRHLVKYPHSHSHGADAAFPYRPCYVDALPANN